MLFDITQYIKKPITGIIQIGAHHGNEYLTLKNICSKILMFEPQKSVFEILRKNVSHDHDIILENCAWDHLKEKWRCISKEQIKDNLVLY
jgi:FkbM family methyltransferase